MKNLKKKQIITFNNEKKITNPIMPFYHAIIQILYDTKYKQLKFKILKKWI